jgi:hypothetical protein
MPKDSSMASRIRREVADDRTRNKENKFLKKEELAELPKPAQLTATWRRSEVGAPPQKAARSGYQNKSLVPTHA